MATTTTITPKVLCRRSRGVFDSVDADDIQDAIDEACRNVSQKVFASRYDDGVFYFACHILSTLALMAASGSPEASVGAVPPGPIQSEKILSWTGTYAVSEGGVFDDALATTSWGREFLRLQNTVCAQTHRVL